MRTARTTSRRRDDADARAARREVRRTELLDAALAAIRRHGSGVSMDAIAAEAGVTKPILYKHFGDRDGLVAALGETFAQELFDTIAGALDEDSEARQILHTTIDAYLAFVERDPELYRFLVGSVLGVGAEVGDAVRGLVPRIARQVALVIGERLRAANRDSAVAEPWAHALVGMVHMSGHWWLERGALPRSFMVDALTRLAWDGMGAEADEET